MYSESVQYNLKYLMYVFACRNWFSISPMCCLTCWAEGEVWKHKNFTFSWQPIVTLCCFNISLYVDLSRHISWLYSCLDNLLQQHMMCLMWVIANLCCYFVAVVVFAVTNCYYYYILATCVSRLHNHVNLTLV